MLLLNLGTGSISCSLEVVSTQLAKPNAELSRHKSNFANLVHAVYEVVGCRYRVQAD